MNIKIIGSGCKKCDSLSDSVKKLTSENNINCSIEKITDIEKIIEMGIMTTPVLMVDGVKVAEGKVPSEKDILGYLKQGDTACSCCCSCEEGQEESSCGCSCGANHSESAGKKLLSLVLIAFVFISLAYFLI